MMQAPQDQLHNVTDATDSLQDTRDVAWSEALRNAAKALTHDLEVEAVLDRLAGAVRTMARSDEGAVLLIDGDKAHVVRTYRGMEPAVSPRETRSYHLGDGILAQTAAERRPVLASGAQRQQTQASSTDVANRRSLLTVPLCAGDAILGFVAVASRRPDAFSSRNVRELEIIASLAAAALQNARLFESLRRERDRLMALASIDQQILAMSDSPQTVIRAMLGHAVRLLGAPKGLSILLSDDAPKVVHTYGLNHDASVKALVDQYWARGQQWIEGMGEGWLAAIDEMPSAPELKPWVEGENIQALMAVPLWLQGRLVGLVALMDTRQRSWKADETHLARVLASQATIAIDKAILAQRLRERLHESEGVVAQLKQLDRLKGQFIQNVSHELRTPLAIVKGYVDLISEGAIGTIESVDPAFSAALSAIRTHTNNLTRIVESITSLSDADVGPLRLIPQSISPICEAALRANWQQALRRNVTIITDVSPDLPLVDLDAEGLSRAISHVVENAIKFSHPGPSSDEATTVWFRALERGNRVWIQVEDKGIGIPSEAMEHIFDRFYQVHGESTRHHGGLGIGLAMVKEIINRHNGEVVVESPGQGLGTTISIILPVSQANFAPGPGAEQL